MKSAGYDVRESNPFEAGQIFGTLRRPQAPIVGRVEMLWESMRGAVVETFPKEPGLPKDKGAYLLFVDGIANSVASYMFGTPDQTGRTYLTVWPTVRQSRVAGFVQDSYKVTANLTLDLGIRYEYYSPVVPRYPGGASNYEPSNNTLLVAGYGSPVGEVNILLVQTQGFPTRMPVRIREREREYCPLHHAAQGRPCYRVKTKACPHKSSRFVAG